MSVFIDTSVLLYAIALRPGDAPKQAIALEILAGADCAFSLQVFNEFLWQSTQTRHAGHLPLETAVMLIRSWRRHPVQSLDLAVFDLAIDIGARTRYSWWDSLIVAAAISLGCEAVMTEVCSTGGSSMGCGS